MTEAEVPMDKLAKVYIKIRDRMAELTREYDAAYEALKEQQKVVANTMKDRLHAIGAESAKTTSGTVSLRTSVRYIAQDKDAFKTFVMENDAIDLLELRIAQKNLQAFLAANPGNVPPGLNTLSEVEVSVRRPTK
jgi:hypothetical protein